MLFNAEKMDEWLTNSSSLTSQCISYGIQTNATVVTDAWIEVLRKHQIKPSVSLDGPEQLHDSCRVDHRGKGSYATVVRGLQDLMNARLDPGVLCVINPGQIGLEAYRCFRSLGIRRMDFLLPDVSHDSKPLRYNGFGPTPVADYLIPIFDEWFEEDDPDTVIRIFVEAIRGVLGGAGRTDIFGSSPKDYLIIETDGAIHSNDALKVCFEGASESGLNVLSNSFDELAQGSPLFVRLLCNTEGLCEKCMNCRERDTCGGGCLPHRYSRERGFLNPSVWCEDILKLLDHVRSSVVAQSSQLVVHPSA